MNIYDLLQRSAYRFMNDKRYTYYDMLRKNLCLSREEMVALQNRLLHKLIIHAYEHTVYYRNLMDSLKLTPQDIRTKDDLNKLPPLTKLDARTHIEQICSDDQYGKDMSIMTSGGSTGNQAYVYQSRYCSHFARAATLRNNLIAGWRPWDKSVWFWGAPYEHQKVEKSTLARIGMLLNRRLLFNAYNYSPDDFDEWVKQIEKFKPRVAYGYATIIHDFAKYIARNNIEFPFIKLVVSTSEALRDREFIEQAFGCDVYDQYGSREINAIGIESPKGIMRIADDVVAMNISEQGDFLITALHSYGFPLINYKIGDRGQAIDSTSLPNDDTLPFTALNLTICRETDNFINRQNRHIAATALATYLSTFGLNIIEHQIIQSDYEKFAVNVVPDQDFNESHYKKCVTDALKEYFGENASVTFTTVDKIPVEQSGKKLMFKRTFLLE